MITKNLPLALGFILVLAFSLPSVSLAETYGGGSGTKADPYQIWIPEQMNTIGLNSGDWGKYFKLMADIDMSAYTGTEYNIIGNPTTYFTGTFDGNAHIIRNLTYSASSQDYVGLFGYVGSGGKILNLGVENTNITGDNYVGGLVGRKFGGTITACYATGTVSGSGSSVGGLVGDNVGTITACYATGEVSGSGNYSNHIGGLVGYNNSSTISACYATGAVSGTSSSVGGLVGRNYGGTISACYATGEVSGSGDVGGLVGYNSSGTINACYATGSVSGSGIYKGGLVGSNYLGTITSCYATGAVSGSHVGGLVGENYGSITACYATGSVTGTVDVGGLVGENNLHSTITASFWDIEASGLSTSSGGTGKTTAEMQTLSTFTDAGWDFVEETANGTDDIWMMRRYPALSWKNIIGISGTTAITVAKKGQGNIVFEVFNLSYDNFNWLLTGFESCAWITSVSPVSGSSENPTFITAVTVHIDTAGLSVGDYTCPLTLSADNSDTLLIPITLSVYNPVDLEEFALLASYWSMSGCESGQPCAAADWFVDGTIDILDLMQLAESWLSEMIIGSSAIEDNFETGNFAKLDWQSGGHLPWTIVSDAIYEGQFAARSGAISNSQSSSMFFTADTTDLTTISFAYKVSSESGDDYLRFYIDGVQKRRWSGTVDWSVAVFPVSDGIHTFEWRYTKDSSASSGSDCAWIDRILIEKP